MPGGLSESMAAGLRILHTYIFVHTFAWTAPSAVTLPLPVFRFQLLIPSQ